MEERGSSPNNKHCPILEIGTEYNVGCLGKKCALWVIHSPTKTSIEGACAIQWMGRAAAAVWWEK